MHHHSALPQAKFSKIYLKWGLNYRAGLPLPDSLSPEDKEPLYEFEKMRLITFCRECCAADGTRPAGFDDISIVRDALSGVTAPNLFGNSINAVLLAGFDATEDTTDWVSTTLIRNYKEQERVRQRHSPDENLDPTPRGGEARSAEFETAGSEFYRATRFTKKIRIDDSDILDDNINLLKTFPLQIGAAARRTRPDLVYFHLLSNPLLADGVPLVDASRGNAGTAALDSTSLAAACEWLRTRMENGIPLGVLPAFLIVCPKLEETARKLLRDREVSGDGGGLQLRVEQRLQSGVTDPSTGETIEGSETRWFLVGSGAPVIEFGQLSEKPRVRTFPDTEGHWGLTSDISWSVGVRAINPDGIYRGNV